MGGGEGVRPESQKRHKGVGRGAGGDQSHKGGTRPKEPGGGGYYRVPVLPYRAMSLNFNPNGNNSKFLSDSKCSRTIGIHEVVKTIGTILFIAYHDNPQFNSKLTAA